MRLREPCLLYACYNEVDQLDRLLRPGPGHPRVGAARLPLHFDGLPRVPHRRRVLLHPLPGAQALRLGAAGFRWLRAPLPLRFGFGTRLPQVLEERRRRAPFSSGRCTC